MDTGPFWIGHLLICALAQWSTTTTTWYRAAENYFSFDNFILKNDWILSQLHALSLVTHFLSHTPNPILNPAFA